ncbi:hypothetical protein [Treponema zioleckii]|uniref:hypothetical protein n=1 Tax=Treponema zioleckii TaxID=331680 RepID=UPI00168B3C5D|nr:hypothetical protein [Treponema zioleckii]
MKKDIFKPLAFILFAGLFIFSFTSCIGDEETTEDGVEIITATESETDTYSASDINHYAFEVAPETKTLTISNLTTGKNVYLAKVNTGESTIAAKYQRTITNSTGASRAALADTTELNDVQPPETQFKHFHAPKIDLESVKTAARSARVASTTVPSPVMQKTYTEGTSTRDIWVDINVNMNQYGKKTAKLYAAGDNCYVWCIESDFTKQGKTSSDIQTVATKFKNSFESFYPIITNVFGNESNNLIDSTAQVSTLKAAATLPMSENSDTGEKINIVIYDIGSDYNATNQCGVLGYFYAKDYFTPIEGVSSPIAYSNKGKYFYIDAIYAADDETQNSSISTLAHEFQHMIDYGVKDIEQGITPDTAYNEMLSMLCEDMMSSQLGLTDSTNVKAERLPYFNTSYFLSGIREYRNDGYAALSYSTSYGFGSWLCRQYGGAKLVKEMSTNNSVDSNSIVDAVNTVTSKSYNFDELFQQFLVACTNGGATSDYTHNQAAAQTLTYSTTYSYPMTAINLWDNAYKYPTDSNKFIVQGQKSAAYDSSATTYSGPFLFNLNYSLALRPKYGMTLYKVGTTNSDTLTLTFSDQGAADVYMYVIIQ